MIDRVHPGLLAHDRTPLAGLSAAEREEPSRILGRPRLVLEGSSGSTPP
ncbi:hypothetical protein [Kitasatospora sp. NPDC056184]